jgi:hypothetical protein
MSGQEQACARLGLDEMSFASYERHAASECERLLGAGLRVAPRK